MEAAKKRRNPFRKCVIWVHIKQETIDRLTRLIDAGEYPSINELTEQWLRLFVARCRRRKIERRVRPGRHDFNVALALYRAGVIRIGQAARAVGMSKPRFLECAGAADSDLEPFMEAALADVDGWTA